MEDRAEEAPTNSAEDRDHRDEEMDDDDDEEEETITSEEVLRRLESAWLNEKLAPEILPHQNEAVECMLGQIQHMEANLRRLPKTDFRLPVHEMELSRIKFVIASYARARLAKIERHTAHVLAQEAVRSRAGGGGGYLTPAELEYARSYEANVHSYLSRVALDRMPGNMQTLDAGRTSAAPDLETHVFLRANETVTGVILEGVGDEPDEEIDMEAGSQHIIQYKAIASLLKAGKVQLI